MTELEELRGLQEKAKLEPRMTDAQWTRLYVLEKRLNPSAWCARHGRYMKNNKKSAPIFGPSFRNS